MARTRTFLELRTEAAQLADLENSAFVSSAEWKRRINQGITKLYDLLVQARGDEYYRASASASTVANTATVALPTTFYKLLGVDYLVGSTTEEAVPLDWASRNDFQNASGWTEWTQVYYQVEGSTVRFWPTPTAVHTITFWHIPYPTDLVNDGDTFDGISGWEDYVVYDAAIFAGQKEQQDVATLMAEREKIERRILTMAQKRDRGRASRTRDVRRRTWSPREERWWDRR